MRKSAGIFYVASLAIVLLAAATAASAQIYGGYQGGYQQGQLSVTQQPIVEYADGRSITIMWKTDQPSTSVIHYGTDPNNLEYTFQDLSSATTHRLQMLNRFQPNTTYYFVAQSGDQQQPYYTSPVFAFQNTTLGRVVREQTPQFLSNGQAGTYANNGAVYGNGSYGNGQYGNRDNQGYGRRDRDGDYARNRNYGVYGNGGYGMPNRDQYGNQSGTPSQLQILGSPRVNYSGGNNAVVIWRTNAQSSSVVKYGTNPNNLDQTAQAPWGMERHQVVLNNLQPNTTYYYQVQSGQAEGTGSSSQSGIMSFHTGQF